MNLSIRPLNLLISLLLYLLAVLWLFFVRSPTVQPTIQPDKVSQLTSGIVAQMDSPLFNYSPGWRQNAQGADPSEPANPFEEPAGTVSFAYQGSELALQIATGDYWGYLYITIDGLPANQLPMIAGNLNGQGAEAGYKPLYEPDNEGATGAGARWLVVHRATTKQEQHQVRVEVWRSWGQFPLRAVAVDALPAQPFSPLPALILFLLASLFLLRMPKTSRDCKIGLRNLPVFDLAKKLAATHILLKTKVLLVFGFGMIGLFIAISGVMFDRWWLCLAGVGMIWLAGVLRPSIWLATFLWALPFYFSFNLPLLPNRSLGLIDVGILGGCSAILFHTLLSLPATPSSLLHLLAPFPIRRFFPWLIAAWALLSTFAADEIAIALHEWRVVFLAAALFALLWHFCCSTHFSNQQAIDIDSSVLIAAWLLGGVTIALIGLWAYATGYEPYLVGAEGVTRLRSVYGSPNNLAAYLERTTAVSLALALFSSQWRMRLILGVALLIQAAALLLTFSKGAIFLGIPAMFFVLALGGALILRHKGNSLRLLWWLAAMLLLVGLMLLPVIGTERLRGLFDPNSTTSLMRINLWRSSWQMSLDHTLFGVGPDNFLYTYRSEYLLPAAWKEPNLNHPHNFLLDWWTRLGMIGLLLGSLWWGSIFHRLWQTIQRGNGIIGRQALQVGILAAAAAALAHGLIDVSYALPDLMIVWVLMAEMGQEAAENSIT